MYQSYMQYKRMWLFGYNKISLTFLSKLSGPIINDINQTLSDKSFNLKLKLPPTNKTFVHVCTCIYICSWLCFCYKYNFEHTLLIPCVQLTIRSKMDGRKTNGMWTKQQWTSSEATNFWLNIIVVLPNDEFFSKNFLIMWHLLNINLLDFWYKTRIPRGRWEE